MSATLSKIKTARSLRSAKVRPARRCRSARRLIFGRRPKPSKDLPKLSRWEIFAVWFFSIAGLGVLFAAVPIMGILPIISSHFPANGVPVPLGRGDMIRIIFYSCLTALFSVVCGGGLKLATVAAPARFSLLLLFIVLILLGYLGDAVATARTMFSSLMVKDPGGSTIRPLTFLEGSWAVPYFALFLVLTGWSLKAPWDRCAQRSNELIARFVSFLNRKSKFDKVGLTAIIATIISIATGRKAAERGTVYDQPPSLSRLSDEHRRTIKAEPF